MENICEEFLLRDRRRDVSPNDTIKVYLSKVVINSLGRPVVNLF